MTVELSAVRLLAPWFGASSGVWTNVIGVVLLALALGYTLGARLSRRPRPDRDLGLVLLLGAGLVAWLPALAAPVARLFMPSGVALDQAASLLTWGSLAASLVLFSPAALTLGCVGPLAVELLGRRRPERPGEAGGRVLGASTLGSLAGTFGTTHLFLPELGLAKTFLMAGGLLGLLGLWLRLQAGGGAAAGLLILLPAGAATGLAPYAPPAIPEDLTLLAERQSPYQALRVVEAGTDSERPMRMLQVNESLDSFQSLWVPEPGPLGAQYYYDHFVPPVWWAGLPSGGGGAQVEAWDLLVLGMGAGTTVRVLEGLLPTGRTLRSAGVEIDPEVVALGEAYFDMETGSPERRVWGGLDGRAALELSPGGYDQIILDSYANNMEVPAHLSTTEFFALAAEKLAPGGWLTVNAAGFGLDDPVVRALAETAAHGLQSPVLLLRVPFSRNCILHGRRDAALPLPGSEEFRVDHPEVAALLAPLDLPGAWALVQPPAEAPLSDDQNPVDRLQLESIAAGRQRWVEGLR